MNKTLFATFAAIIALSLTAMAAPEAKKDSEGEKVKLSADAKALRKEMAKKYDTDKDGKLSKEEKAKISAEDKAKMDKAGLNKKHGKKQKE